MEATERKITLILCAMVCLSCGVKANRIYYLDMDKTFQQETATINIGATVILVCNDWSKTERVTWYKSPTKVVIAEMNYNSGTCDLTKYGTDSLISSGNFGCTVGRLYITISRIQYRHEGGWFCTADGRSSNILNITLSGISLSSPTISTTQTSTVTPITTTKTTLVPTSLPKSEAVTIEETETTMVVTEGNVKTRDNMIPLTAGAVSGTVALIVIVIMVMVLVAKRWNFQKGKKRTHYHGSVRQQDIDNDELVMADNPLYAQYNHEENQDKRLNETTHSYETVPDVYSVVQNTAKSEATVPNAYSPVQNTVKSEATMPDVYSAVQNTDKSEDMVPEATVEVYEVVQTPLKSQTLNAIKDDEEVADVCNVVQKPAKK